MPFGPFPTSVSLSLVFPEDSHAFCSPRGFSLAVGSQKFLRNASVQSRCRCPERPEYQHFQSQGIRYQGPVGWPGPARG